MGSNDRLDVYSTLVMSCAVVSCTASILNLAIIYDMKTWTGYIALITVMSACQLLYDLSFFSTKYSVISGIDESNPIFIISSICQCVGGLVEALICNEMSAVVLYTVKYQSSFDILDNFNWLLSIAFTPPMIAVLFFVLYLSMNMESLNDTAIYIYLFVRLVSVVSIIAIHVYTSYHVYRTTKNATMTRKDIAIQTLIRRLQWYPILQASTRLPYFFYEFYFTFLFSPFSHINTKPIQSSDNFEFVIIIVTVLLQPAISVGYLAIFLAMQPNALKCVLSRLMTGQRYVLHKKLIRSPPQQSSPSPKALSNNISLRASNLQSTAEIYDTLEDDELLYELSFETIFNESGFMSMSSAVNSNRNSINNGSTNVRDKENNDLNSSFLENNNNSSHSSGFMHSMPSFNSSINPIMKRTNNNNSISIHYGNDNNEVEMNLSEGDLKYEPS